jgi:hypothetical protein
MEPVAGVGWRQAGVYGATRSGQAYLAAAFAFANHWMSTDRFAFAGDLLTAKFNAQTHPNASSPRLSTPPRSLRVLIVS